MCQKQKDMTEEILQTGRQPPHTSLLSVDVMENLGKELIQLCDRIEQHGLVDYEMGVWEEEILSGRTIPCSDGRTSLKFLFTNVLMASALFSPGSVSRSHGEPTRHPSRTHHNNHFPAMTRSRVLVLLCVGRLADFQSGLMQETKLVALPRGSP